MDDPKRDPAGRASNFSERCSVCWLGSARYPKPMSETQARKWALLSELKHRQYVIGFSQQGRPQHFQQHAQFMLLPQSRFSLLRHLTLLILGGLTLIWVCFRYRCRVLIAQSPYEGVICVFVALLGKIFFRRRTIIIIESHNDFKETLFLQRKVFAAKLYRKLMQSAVRFSLKRADLFRPVSSSTAAQLRQFAPRTTQVRFIAWTDAAAFATREARTFPAPTLVYAGALIPRKGVHHLLRAFAACHETHPQAQLKIIGAPTNVHYAESLRSLANELGIADRVAFLGELSQVELGAQFKQARCSVLPSLSEALGRVLVESQLAGTPVIATDVGGMPDVVRDGETGLLIPAGNAPALKRAIEDFLAMDAETWRDMSENARRFAQETFSAEAYLAGYRQLLAIAHDRLKQDGS
ncbi:MAG: glycosyltransferase [Anaerolineaceae bacterium]|nr:glycosyltransferase [Anaerolineaceae bacterium]